MIWLNAARSAAKNFKGAVSGQNGLKALKRELKLKDFDEADSAGITPLRHVPIWKGSERTLYDLAAYIKDKVDAMKDGKPPPDLTDYAMEGFAPLSL